MPYFRKVSFLGRSRRGRAATRIQRAYRGRRRYRRARRSNLRSLRKKPTVKSLARAVRHLYQRDDKKFFFLADPATPVWDNSTFTILGNATALNSCPAADSALPNAWNKREPFSTECNLRTIRIHMLIEKNLNTLDRFRYQPYWIALIKTTNKIGTPTIECPTVGEVFDPAAEPVAGNRLSRFDTFRTQEGPGSETLQTTKVLKVWSGVLQSPGYLQPTQLLTVGTSTDGAGQPNGLISNDAGAGAPANCNYQATYPCRRLIKYSHKCLGAKVKFDSATGPDAMNPINNHYYLVAMGTSQNQNRDLYNVSTMIKINFSDE